jgi:hypothetical protein
VGDLHQHIQDNATQSSQLCRKLYNKIMQRHTVGRVLATRGPKPTRGRLLMKKEKLGEEAQGFSCICIFIFSLVYLFLSFE